MKTYSRNYKYRIIFNALNTSISELEFKLKLRKMDPGFNQTLVKNFENELQEFKNFKNHLSEKGASFIWEDLP